MTDERWSRDDEYQFRLEAIRRNFLYGDGPEGRRRAETSRYITERYGPGPIWHVRDELEPDGPTGETPSE